MPSHDGTERQHAYITPTGWRVIGRKPPNHFDPEPEPTAEPLLAGRPEDTLYAVVATIEARAQGTAAVELVLDAIHESLGDEGRELPLLRRDVEVSRPPSRYTGLSFRHRVENGEWSGHLRWRGVHPIVPGAPVTTEVTLEERRSFTRVGVRVAADRGLPSVRGAVGAGHAQPGFLRSLRPHVAFTWMGAPVGPVEVPLGGEADLVRSVLEAPGRTLPTAVLAPLEEGGYLLDPEDLAFDLLGRARLYLIRDHAQTFRLTDAVGDKRLSCFWGALRAYMPGFTVHDDLFDHPLLVADRLTDPVMRASMLGQLGIAVGRDIRLPEVEAGALGETIDQPGSAAERTGGSRARPHTSNLDETEEAESPRREEPEPVADRVDAAHEEQSEEVSLQSASEDSASALRAEVGSLTGSVRELTAHLEELLEANRALVDEVERLRTISSVRSAGTSALERRMSALETLITRAVEPEWASSLERETSVEESAEPRYTLSDAVRDAADTHPDTLLMLDSAFASASESPYEDPERVRAILDAMARVARKRRDGELNASLREAFGDFGVDYRGGIARSTPERLRQQYRFIGPDGQTVECVEHIALGQTYDPRRCLRIYFSSRVPSETRVIVAHVGRHFEVITST